MNQYEFAEQIARLEEHYKDSLTDSNRRLYFDRLGGWPMRIMRRAVDLLLDNHPYKRLPLISEVMRALKLAYRETARMTAEDLQAECPRCENQGWVVAGVVNEQAQAAPCSCWRGQKIKFAEEERMRKKIREIQPRDLGYPQEEEVPF